MRFKVTYYDNGAKPKGLREWKRRTCFIHGQDENEIYYRFRRNRWWQLSMVKAIEEQKHE